MTAPTWLINALEQCDSRALDNVEDRLAVTDALVDALERQTPAILESVGSSLRTQLLAEGLVGTALFRDPLVMAALDRVARNVTTSAIGALEKTST